MRFKKFIIVNNEKHYQCNKCKCFKSNDKFYKDKRSPIGITSSCKPCHTETTLKTRDKDNARRLTRESAERQRKRNPEKFREIWRKASSKKRGSKKVKARDAVNKAVLKGDIIKPILCEICRQDKKLNGHHSDYNKPLEVEWLCNKCHGEEHRHD